MVLPYPEGFARLLYKGYSAPVLSIKAHAKLAFFFFSFNTDGQMAVERMGPSDIKGVDVTCCRIEL